MNEIEELVLEIEQHYEQGNSFPVHYYQKNNDPSYYVLDAVLDCISKKGFIAEMKMWPCGYKLSIFGKE